MCVARGVQESTDPNRISHVFISKLQLLAMKVRRAGIFSRGRITSRPTLLLLEQWGSFWGLPSTLPSTQGKAKISFSP